MPTSTEQRGSIRLTKLLERRLLDSVRERLPKKSFGFILSDGQNSNPTDFVSFEHNVRNSDLWRATFETYGKYFIDHDDAGFVADPRESWRIQQEIRNRGMREIGIFHSHLRHPANFSKIDMEMHLQCFEDLWHLIISMRNPAIPQLRVFRVCQRSVQELDWTYISETGAESSSDCGDTLGDSRDDVEEVLELDSADRPKCGDTRKIFRVVTALLRSKNKQVIKKYLTEGFCRHSQQRYHDYIAGDMAILPSVRLEMGTPLQLSNHFCGESPRHTVELSPFGIAKTPVTNEIFGLFSGRQCGLSEEERRKPVLGVTWFDAAVLLCGWDAVYLLKRNGSLPVGLDLRETGAVEKRHFCHSMLGIAITLKGWLRPSRHAPLIYLAFSIFMGMCGNGVRTTTIRTIMLDRLS
jgi:proteasome lid subunit RPN8/RPN11